ncbi:hypothetical protein BG004_000331, partial [Podila humilis]
MFISARRRARWITLPLLLFVFLTLLHARLASTSPQSYDYDEDGDGDGDRFEDDVDIEDDYIDDYSPTSTPTLPSPSPSLPPPPPPPPTVPPIVPPTTPVPVPSGILKAGTASPECAIFGDLYRATGPWRFVPDVPNCCNAEYPNSSGVKCNPQGQIGKPTIPIAVLQQPLWAYSVEPITPTASYPRVDLSHNRLTGSLPSSAGGWSSLGTLNLESNALTGTIPDWLMTLPSLHSLAIGQNLFTTGDPVPPFSFNVEPNFIINNNNVSTPTKNIIPANTTPSNYVTKTKTAQIGFLTDLWRVPEILGTT